MNTHTSWRSVSCENRRIGGNCRQKPAFCYDLLIWPTRKLLIGCICFYYGFVQRVRLSPTHIPYASKPHSYIHAHYGQPAKEVIGCRTSILAQCWFWTWFRFCTPRLRARWPGPCTRRDLAFSPWWARPYLEVFTKTRPYMVSISRVSQENAQSPLVMEVESSFIKSWLSFSNPIRQ